MRTKTVLCGAAANREVDRAGQLRAANATAGDRGSGALWLLVISLVVLFAGAVTSVRALAALARHRAESAADFAALAGAIHAVEGDSAACGAARSIATANSAQLSTCTLNGAVVTVTVSCSLTGGLSRWRAHAVARAGPAP
jgi:secretion/DNA translocation related TadE-like protein